MLYVFGRLKSQTKLLLISLIPSFFLKCGFLCIDSLQVIETIRMEIIELLYLEIEEILKNLKVTVNMKMQEFSILYCILYNR